MIKNEFKNGLDNRFSGVGNITNHQPYYFVQICIKVQYKGVETIRKGLL